MYGSTFIIKYSAARQDDFKELQYEMDLKMHNFQQHTEVCWLSIGPAIKRVLEQWKLSVNLSITSAKMRRKCQRVSTTRECTCFWVQRESNHKSEP